MNREKLELDIGTRRNGRKLRYAMDERNANAMALVTGTSGSGKTNFSFYIMQQAIKQGTIVFVPDYSGSIDIRKFPRYHTKVYDVENFPVSPFSELSQEETHRITAKRCADFLGQVCNLGINQKVLLQKIVVGRLERGVPVTIKRIAYDIEMQLVYFKNSEFECLKNFVKYAENDAFETSDKRWDDLYDESGILYVIRFSENYSRKEQIFLSELIMLSLFEWLRARGQDNCIQRIQIHLDEAQDLNLSEKSAVSLLMRQGRKYGCSLILYTQSLFTFEARVKEVFSQASLFVNFKQTPIAAKKFANLLEDEEEDCQKNTEQLKNLKRGQAVAWGRFLKDNGENTNLVSVLVEVPEMKDYIDLDTFQEPLLLIDKQNMVKEF